MENSGRSAGDIAVNENGDALMARGEDGTCHGSDLAPAQPAQDFERVGDVLQMQVKSAPHRIDLTLQTSIIDTGASANPVLGPAAVERAGHSRRNGGVANTHFANAQKVGAGNGLHAKSNGGSAVGFVECGIKRYVASRRFQSKFEHLQSQAEGTAELIYGGATRLKVGYHLSGDLGGIGTDPLPHNAVIAGKNYYNGIVNARRVPSLPSRQPLGEFFQAAQGTWRFGERGITPPDLFGGSLVGTGKGAQKAADTVERADGERGCHCMFPTRWSEPVKCYR